MFHKKFTIPKYLLLFVIMLLALTSIWLAPTHVGASGVLVIHTEKAEQRFYVELATTPEKQEKGLMFRKSLAEDSGMLFIFPNEQPINMWMKDTIIPLDMVFIDVNGKIIHIKENAQPESLSVISSHGLAKAVLEIAGGASAKKDIKIGDMVDHASLIPLISIIFILFVPHASHAEAGFLYQHTELRIIRQNPPTLPALPWQADEGIKPSSEPAQLRLEVDIRDSFSLYRQEGWFQLSQFAEGFGMLFVFDRAQNAALDNTPIYTPLDVLWVDAEGNITQIIPGIILANLSKALSSKKAVKAIMFMNGGECARLQITPGDRITGLDIFQPPPPMVLEMKK